MSIKLTVPTTNELKPRITVFGVGGAGGNAVNNMIDSGLEGVEFVVANTDAQALLLSSAERCIQLGTSITEGLGAGSRPEVGCAAAEEALNEILDNIQGSHMVFITAGMGGGTGTGGAPVIARAAREQGILTVGVVTKPFQFEGSRRARIAEEGISELQQYVDTLIVIPNQNLFRIANEHTTFADAFAMADQVLHSGVAGITDLMMKPGLINLDFADVRTVMNEMGKAMMGTGEATGEKRAIDAAEAAISNPLLDEVSMKGAKGVLINITGGMDLTLYEVDEAANRIRAEVDPDANIIVGSTFDETLDGKMRVSVVATGIEAQENGQSQSPQNVAVLRTAPKSPPRFVAPKAAARTPMAESEEAGEPQVADVPPAAPRETVLADMPEGLPGGMMELPGGFDAREYEAEVIIHKPARADAPREADARAKPAAKLPGRPYIPGDLERVAQGGAEKGDIPAFLGNRPAAVAPSQPPRKGPSLFERISAARRGWSQVADPGAERREPALQSDKGGHSGKAARGPLADQVVDRRKVRAEPVVKSPAQPAPSSLSAEENDQLVQVSFEEEQLEIPTFLRRQAN